MASASKIEWTDKNRTLLERLRRACRFIHVGASGRLKMTTEQKLTDEALSCAERGDFDEARHRLRLRDHPKWSSPQECQAAYDSAMAAKRGVTA
jgi:hypothetical protein